MGDQLVTHAELVFVAGRWLAGTRQCGVVLLERGLSEIPDAIGWAKVCIVVEVKVSRADFFADLKKPHRHPQGTAFGRERWYLTPPGLLGTEEIPAPWGLLEWTGRIVRKRKLASEAPYDEANILRENRLLLSELRAYHAQGIGYKTLTGRHVVPVAFMPTQHVDRATANPATGDR